VAEAAIAVAEIAVVAATMAEIGTREPSDTMDETASAAPRGLSVFARADFNRLAAGRRRFGTECQRECELRKRRSCWTTPG
jgi:hypothetical protein